MTKIKTPPGSPGGVSCGWPISRLKAVAALPHYELRLRRWLFGFLLRRFAQLLRLGFVAEEE